jgi:hypothetical protein
MTMVTAVMGDEGSMLISCWKYCSVWVGEAHVFPLMFSFFYSRHISNDSELHSAAMYVCMYIYEEACFW